jgi:hypothetical protein
VERQAAVATTRSAVFSIAISVTKNVCSAATDYKFGNKVGETFPDYIHLGVNRGVRRLTQQTTGIVKVGGYAKGARGLSKAGLLGVALTGVSVYTNYHSGYSSSEALGRSAIDVAGTAILIGLAFTPIGIFTMVGAAVIVTIVSEVGKRKIYND